MTSTKKTISNDGQPMLSARKVATRLKCAPDYVSKLCREGKLVGEQISGQWFVVPASIDEFESLRAASKELRSAQLAEQRRSEQTSYQIEHGTLIERFLLRVKKVSVGAPIGMAFGTAMLFGALVFASTMATPTTRVGDSLAAVTQAESPFFGTQAPAVTLPTSTGNAFAGATDFLSNMFSALFGGNTKIAEIVPPTNSAPLAPSDSKTRGQSLASQNLSEAPARPAGGSATVVTMPQQRSSAVPQNRSGSVAQVLPTPSKPQTVVSVGVSEAELTSRLQDLYNRLAVQISNLQNPGHESPLQNFVVSERINNLSNVRLNGDTIADNVYTNYVQSAKLNVSGDTAIGGSLSAGQTTVSGLSITGNSTTTGGLYVGGNAVIAGSLSVQNDNGTPGSAFAGTTTVTNIAVTNTSTSTFAGPLSLSAGLTVAGNAYFQNPVIAQSSLQVLGDTLLVNATSTNFFSDTASTTNLFAQNASLGSVSVTQGYFQSVGIGIATSAPGVLQTSSNAYIGGNLFVGGNSTTIGNSSSNSLVINSSIKSNLTPDQNIQYDLGSPSFFWRNVYVGNIVANNISAASTTIAGTASATFTINSDNVSSDAEDMDLIFFRGNVVPNALISWKSVAKRFELNQATYISNQSGSLTTPTLTLQGSAGQTSDIFQIASSSGSTLFAVGPYGATTTGNAYFAGNVGIGTTSPFGQLSVNPNGITGPAFVIGSSTATLFSVSNTGLTTIKGTGTNFTQIGDNGFGNAIVLNGSALSGNNYNFYSAAADTRLFINRPSAKDMLFLEANTVTQMIIKGTTGNVGIGTSSPTYRLSVEGTSSLGNQAIAGYFTATSTTASTFAGGITSSATTTSTYFAASITGTAGAPAFTFAGDSNTGMYNIGADQLGFTAGGTLRAQATANGFGIGAAPSTVSNTNTALVVQGTGSQENKMVIQTEIGTNAVIEADRFGGAISQSGVLRFSKQGGLIASPTSLSGNDTIGLIDFQVRNTGGLASPAQITAYVPGSANNPNTPANLNFLVSNGSDTSAKSALIITAGAASAVNYLQIANSATLAGPTISAQGSDTDINLNFTPKGAGNSIFTAGNVGVGTTSPFAKLSVKGSGSTTGVNFQTTNSSDSPLFTILDNGRVGIGSSTPNRKLVVSGVSAATGVNQGDVEFGYSGTSVAQEFGRLFNSFGNSVAYTQSYSNVNNSATALAINPFGLGSGGYVSVGTTTAYAAFGLRSGGNTSATRAFEIANFASTTLFLINDAGSVGIGTTTPGSRLSVQGTTDATVANIAGSSNLNYALIVQNGGGSGKGLQVNTGSGSDNSASILSANNSTGTNYFTVTNGNSYFQNGNVGIGSTTPNTLLTVTSASGAATGALIRMSNLGSGGGLYTDNGLGSGVFSLTRQDTVATGDLSISAVGGIGLKGGGAGYNTGTASGFSLYVASTGNVGIGTTSPGYTLGVSGSASFGSSVSSARRLDIDSSGAVSSYYGDNSNRTIWTSYNQGITGASQGNNIAFRMSSTTANSLLGASIQALTESTYLTDSAVGLNFLTGVQGNPNSTLALNANRNVGISSSTPWARLSVVAAGTGTGYTIMAVNNSGTPIFNVQDNGNVGIGTTTPIALLDVGTFNTSNANIRTGSLELQPYGLNNAFIGENVYYDGSKFAYRRTGAAGLLAFSGTEGGFRWAASGSAGANAGMATYQLKTGSDGAFAVGPSVSGSVGNFSGATFSVSAAGTAYLSGSLGIGTTSPQALLGLQGGIGVNSTHLYLSAAGTVGVGTANTNAKFTVNGPGANPAHGELEISNSAVTSNVGILGIETGTNSLANGGTLGDFSVISSGSLILQAGGGGTVKINNTSTAQAQFYGWSQLDTDSRSGALFIGSTASFRGVIQYGANPSSSLSIDNTYDSSTGVGIQFRTRTSGVSTTTAMTIMNNGNVGVGTTSPATNLSVGGVGYFTNALGIGIVPSGSTGLLGLQNTSTGGGVGFISETDNGWSAGGNKLVFGAGTTAASANIKLTLDNSTGSVGIGTTSPFAKLSVTGSDTSNTTRGVIFADSANAPKITFTNGGSLVMGTTTLYNTATPIQLGGAVGGADWMRFCREDSSFFCSFLSSNNAAFNYTNSGVGFFSWSNGATFANGSWSGGTQDLIARSGMVAIGTTTNNTGTGGHFQIWGKRGFTDYFQVTNADGGTATPIGDVFKISGTGSVGIGTSTPNSALQIAGVGQKSSTFNDTGAQTATLNIEDNDPVNGAGSGGAIMFSSAATAGTYAQAGIKALLTNGSNRGIGDLAFMTRNATTDTALTERLRLTSAGNFGIGTTTPSQALSVQGNALISGTLSVANVAATGTVSWNGDTGISRTAAGAVAIGNGTAGNTSGVLRVDGGLGIGLAPVDTGLTIYNTSVNNSFGAHIYNQNSGSSASATLHFNNSVTNSNINLYGTGVATSSWVKPNGLAIISDGPGGIDVAASAAAGSINFWTGGSNQRMVISSAGNVGIGTGSSALYKLDVKTATDQHLFVRSPYSGQDGITLQSGNDADNAFKSLTLEGSQVLINAATGGSVGIGTTTPGTILSIGNTGVNTINISATATSTFGSGINIRTGCYAVNGTCIGGGKAPTQTVLTSGTSATYTVPAGVKYLKIRMVGAGGGGGGAGGSTGGTGGTGGTSSFNSITAVGGSGGTGGTTSTNGTGGVGGTGGTGTAAIRLTGANGSGASNPGVSAGGGGAGGSTPFGGAGGSPATQSGAANGINAAANTGSGGSGATSPGFAQPAAGGGAGEYVEIIIPTPSASYTYTVGAAGTGGTATGSGAATGGNGAAGVIVIEENYVGTGNDYAENYPTTDTTLSAGEIVSFDSTNLLAGGVVRASGTSTPVGIVSTQPGQLLGVKDSVGEVPLALAGRVPVKVNFENGDIHVGDRIALSSVAGVGRKAKVFEASVGTAVEDHVQGQATGDTVTVYVGAQQGIDISSLEQNATTTVSELATSSTSSIVGGFSSTLQAAVGNLGSMIVKAFNGAISAAVGIFNKVYAHEVHTDQLCISDNSGETCITKTQLDALLSGNATSTPNGGGNNGNQNNGGGSATSTPPTITLIGDNPAQITVGDVYIDPGVTVDSVISPGIGYTMSLDGATSTSPDQFHLDTSTSTTHVILYSATDQNGNTGTATRTVIVQ